MANVKTIPSLANMMPILCLTTDSFPLFVTYLHLDDSSPTEIHLPIVAASSPKKGRIICFSQLKILHDKYLHTADTSQMISNSLNWLSGTSANTPLLLLGFDKATISNIIPSIQSLGFKSEPWDQISKLSKYKCILIPTNIKPEMIPNITEYVNNGGGLAIFYSDSEIEPINKFLLQFGLSYTNCLLNENFDTAECLQASPSYNYIEDSHFLSLISQFIRIVNSNEIEKSELDCIVTTLRYYVMVCDESHTHKLLDIAKNSWDYLERTHYSTKEGIFPEINQIIVSLLLSDLYAKLPVDKLNRIKDAALFPGETGTDVEFENFDLSFDLIENGWTSTGLWIPSSKIATVSGVFKCAGDVFVQIGSHSESLLTKCGPWKRWSNVISNFMLNENSVNVGSAFGGIVYLRLEEEKKLKIKLNFDGFCRHPRAVVSDPDIWEKTKNINVPWGELDTGKIIFTLPSSKLREISDFNKVKDVYDVILNGISCFMSCLPNKKYRIVFDIETLDDEFAYPIFLNIDEIDHVLIEIDHPTAELFKAVLALAIVSIRQDIFDNQIEVALASVAAADILKKLFADFDPTNFEGIQLPVLFNELWEIHCNFNDKLIPRTLRKFNGGEYNVSKDTWLDFVEEMCFLGKRDFTKLFENSRPFLLSKSSFLQGLKPYKPL